MTDFAKTDVAEIDAARWEEIQAVFHLASDLPRADQRVFVERRCNGDRMLIGQVLALLDEDVRGSSFLDRGVAHAARAVFDASGYSSLPNFTFGPYRLTRPLGEGGMGVVYLAERDDLGSVAAIKLLRDGLLSPSRRERFLGEQRTLAQLSHPCIARLFDAGALDDGTPWIAMEYVDGEYLTKYCHAKKCTVAERLKLFRDVCDAVQHAHSHLVVHRDIKPSNVLVTADGGVKLLDFGIAKQLGDDGDVGDATQTGLRLLTPAYAAPEQLTGGRVGTHTDVYALGVVLYELLTGRLPFDLAGRTPSQAAAVIVEQSLEKPSVAARRAPDREARAAWADLDVLCLTAMHRDPQQRYRTVDALIRDVDHFLKGEPLEARPDTLRYRLRKFAQRRRVPLAAAAAVFVFVVALVASYTVRLQNARNAAVAETARTARIQGFVLNLLQGGDNEVGPADSLRVLTVVERGAQEAASLDAEPAVQAELYQTLGGVLTKLGRLDRADTLLRASLEARRTLYGADHPDVARSLIALARLRVEQARMPEAERLVRDGLAMSRRLRPPDHPDVADATTALGRVLEARGTFAQAIPVLEEAVRLQATRGSRTPDLAKAIVALADNHFYAGHFDVADSLYRRSLAISQALHGEKHPLIGDSYISLGAVQLEKGNYAEAEKYDRSGLAIMEQWYGPDDPRTASAQTMLARALVRQARYDDATPLLVKAMSTQEHIYGGVHPKVASALNELGTVAMKGKRLDDADAYFARMADIYRQVYGGGHYLLGIAIANRGSVAIERKDNVRAEVLFREAMVVYGKSLAPDHLNFGITRVKLGRALARQARWTEAEREILTGYAILEKQTSPSVSWLKAARTDLAMVYDSLGRRDEAAKYREAAK
jgi:serine/threonine protein kinase/tetratricopeptide (TPR) repeat protein